MGASLAIKAMNRQGKTHFVAFDSADPRHLHLTAGRMLADVAHIEGRPAQIATPAGTIDVVGTRFVVPPSCNEFPEIHRLLLSMGLRQAMPNAASNASLTSNRAPSAPLAPMRSQPASNRPQSPEAPFRNGMTPIPPPPDKQPPPPLPSQAQRATPLRESIPGRTPHLPPDPWDDKRTGTDGR